MQTQEGSRFVVTTELNLIPAEKLRPPPGISTGMNSLDRFLLWNGIPKGALSSLNGTKGWGATSLWVQMASALTKQNKHVAWVESAHTQLNPWHLRQKDVDLKNLFVVSAPRDLKQLLWALQELCSLDLFEMVTCSLDRHLLKDHQLLKLKRLARRHQTAVVFLSERSWTHPHLDVSLSFHKDRILVVRALHRPTPHILERREPHAHALPEFVPKRKVFGG